MLYSYKNSFVRKAVENLIVIPSFWLFQFYAVANICQRIKLLLGSFHKANNPLANVPQLR